MALPSPKFYTSTGGEITTHDFESCEAGEYKPGSSGWSFRLYNAYGSTGSDTMTSVKISIRDDDGGTDEIWVQQHWVQIKSSSGSTGVVDDAQTAFSAVGKNKELSLGDIPSGEYRTLFARCYPPTDAEEQDVDFQLRVTFQNPQTSICNWITGLRGNGVVASTGNPFAMSTGGTTGQIPYEAGYALIYNNEVYYGSSGDYDISTTGSGTYKIYLSESGAFNETTGSVAANELSLYEATISSGVCTALSDKRVYLAGLQAGTTGAMPTTPDLGDLYLDVDNGGVLYAAVEPGSWTVIVPGATFEKLTDTPDDYTGYANKFLSVSTGEDAIEFVTPTATEVEVSEIGTATYDDMQDFIDNTQSGGRISGGDIGDDSSGGITISSGTGLIQTTTDDIGLTQSFDWSADAIASTGLTDDSANYIYMDYNSGTPQILATADRTSIRLQDQFTMGRIYKSGTDLHILQSGINLYNAFRRSHERLVAVRNFERASGGVISESAVTERAIESTIGNFYMGLNKIATEAQNTSTGGSDYFTTHYYIDGAWASSTGQTQISNTQYNNPASTGLEPLTGVHFGVHWAYIHFESDIHVVYGQGDYTLAQAEMAVVPDTLPSMVEDFGTLASKIIIQRNSANFNSIVTAYKVLFPVTNPAEHNDLGALDTADYQHLTQAEHDIITSTTGVGTDYLSATGGWTTPPGATGGATNFLQLTDTPADYTDDAGKYVKVTTGEDALEFATPPGGEANTASNVNTTGVGVYEGKVGVDLQFKGIRAGSSKITATDTTGTHTVSIDVNSTGILLDSLGTPSTGTTLNSSTGRHGLLLALNGSTGNYLRGDGSWQTPPGADGGEVNTASNVGTGGEVYKQKTGVDLEFRKIEAGSNQIDVSWYTEAGPVSQYPPAHSDTYVKATSKYGEAYWAYFATDPANSLTGSAESNRWLCAQWTYTNQRFHIDLGSAKIIRRIYYENFHHSGAETDRGVKNFTFWGSNTEASFLALTYGTDTGWTELTVDNDNKFDEHVALDQADPKYINVTNFTEYRYYAFKFADNYGSETFLGVGRIELQTNELSYKDQIEIDVNEGNIRLDDLKATEDNTDLNASTTAHGLMPKLPFSGDLLSTTTVAFNADADTTLYTVPTGKRCVLSHAIVVAAGDAGASTTLSIGANGTETDFIPANTLSNLDAQYDSAILQPIPNTTPLKIKSYAAATVIEAQVANQSGAAGNTIYLFGITY